MKEIDLHDALARVAGKKETLVSLFKTFLETGPADLEKICRSIEDRAWADAEFQAHNIKGEAGNISAVNLFKSAGDLEAALNRQHLPVIQKAYDRFSQNMKKTVKEVAWAASLDLPDRNLTQGDTIQAGDLPSALEQMERCLEEYDMKARELVTRIKPGLVEAGLPELAHELETHITALEFEKGLEVHQKVMTRLAPGRRI